MRQPSRRHLLVREWLAAHPRFVLHFTPTGSSWTNLIERVFSELTVKQLRRGAFGSVKDLTKAIYAFINEFNRDPKPFTWTASVESILEKLRRCKALYRTLH